MKKIKGTIILAIAVLLGSILTISTAQAIPTVRLEIPDPVISVGEVFDVNVIADGVTDIDPFLGPDELLAFGFDLVYDSGLVFNGAAVGSSFFDDSGLFPNTDVTGSAFPGIMGDNILLASLSFTPSTAGSFSLGISSDLSDPNEGLITWLYPQIDITTSTDVNVVPEPSTLLLMGAGLAGLGMRKRRRERRPI